MRRTRKNLQLMKAYQLERRQGFTARNALSNARTRIAWAKHDADEHNPQRGDVRLRIVPDDYATFEDLTGDVYSTSANPDIPASRLKREAKIEMERINRLGVVGIIGEYFDGEQWQHADSCFGFVGDDWKNTGYDTDIMQSALDAARSVKVCRCCNRPKLAVKAVSRA
jgi:hypothetical protein